MNTDEANEIATQIARIWPNDRINTSAWIEPLQRLEPGPARRTVRDLRDTSDKAPTIAAFIRRHRELNHVTGPATHRIECDICGGNGWETITVQRPNYPIPTTGVIPCRCTNGRTIEASHAGIIADIERAIPEPNFRHRHHGDAA